MAFTVFRRFFGGAVNTASGYAIGGAMQPALDPLTQDLANRTWALHPDRPVDPVLLAEAVAQGQIDHDTAAAEAAMSGINGTRFDQMRAAFDTGPGVALAFDLWRRGVIDEAGFRRAVKRAALEPEWIDALVQIHDVLLSADQLANAVVQGHMSLDTATAEAEKLGYTAARFAVLVANTGLPPGPETLLAWLRRGIIDEAQFVQGVLEGHTKPKYTQAYLDALHPVLSHTTYAGLFLRGWINRQQMNDGGALTGYTADQMDLEYKNRGRPATTHQVHIGYARGGRLPGIGNDEQATFRRAVEQSDIRPEYFDLLWESRYTYPTTFALRSLTQSGDISVAEAEQVLLYEGWEPTFAKKVAEAWTPKAAATAENPWVSKADNQLWTALHKAYVKTGAPRTEVEPILSHLIPQTAPRDAVFTDWDFERQAQALQPPPTP